VYDLDGNSSTQSNELILTPQVSGDLTPPGAIRNIGALCDDGVSITVVWDADDSPDLSHYLLHYGSMSGFYSGMEAEQGRSPIKVSSDLTALTITGLNKGSRYYFNVQAADTNGNTADLGVEASQALISEIDDDEDGMPDDWEVLYWASIAPDAGDDSDGDGVMNSVEYAMMTNPKLKDTDMDRIPDNLDPSPVISLDLDNDGIGDDWENYYGVDNAEADADNDGLTHLQEYKFKTDPFAVDTDADQIPDGDEVYSGSDPADPDSPNPRCPELGVEIEMPSHLFLPGDPCSPADFLNDFKSLVYSVICNSYPVPIPSLKFFAVLDAYGVFYYAPGWTQLLDFWEIGIEPGPRTLAIIPEFTWPAGVGSASDLYFYGVMTNSDITRLMGEFDVWEFGWSE